MTEQEYEELGEIERERLILYNLIDCYNFYIYPYLQESDTLEKEIGRDTLLRNQLFDLLKPYRRHILNFEFLDTIKNKLIDFSRIKLLFKPERVDKDRHKEQHFICRTFKALFEVNIKIKKALGRAAYVAKFMINVEDYVNMCSFFNKEYVKIAIHTGYKLTLHSDFGHLRVKRRINRDVMETEIFSRRRKVINSFLDFAASNKRKKELIEQNIKPLVRFKDTYRNILGTNNGEDFYVRYIPEFVTKIRFLPAYGRRGKLTTSKIYYYPVSTAKRYLNDYKKENPTVENNYLKY